MRTSAWILALLLVLAGAGYLHLQQQVRAKQEACKLQKEKEELAREHLHAFPNKKAKHKLPKVDVTAELKKKKEQASAAERSDTEHSSILHVLKGHKYIVTAAAYSPNNRFIATASLDRSIRIYFRDTLKAKKPKVHQINLEYDHVTAMCFSPDGRNLVIATVNGHVKVYQKLRIKPDIFADFPISHSSDVHSVHMNDIGNWATIITCASESDTEVKFWNLRGELLQIVNTNQVANYHCVGSKDNRYVAVAAYTPEVKIYEITREKAGNFKKANKIMTLQGHRAGVMDLAFNGSDTLAVDRVVTIYKDASIRVWNINVRYSVQEDPKVLSSFSASDKEPFQTTDYAPNGKMLVMARDKALVFIRTRDNRECFTIENALDDRIKRATYSPDGSEVLVVGNNCKHVKIYKTPEL